ncbi:outer membrane autotransporter barrel domain-containing protein [Luteibacter sp. UNC138MFCol5.1]|uniref:autotransporter outer membrane beta-barrel domain-containing protein n=1 Tax=Luteibacter sp. UNC138MFCol5.1 TaxID=1502774 RepID=UPI0008CF4BA2|nr:autotransporter outer membrane beta-barrel domain-containing protein [Luteibacter sp. UNC138MFCol5.1]SEO61284.1 outer membrane autotransporter barrel domain-containing protein [Luteibacter sp. UNC138MFCol5.1]
MSFPIAPCRVSSGRRRRATLFLAVAAALSSGTHRADAQTVTLGAYDPSINDNQSGAAVVDPGATLTLTGPQRFAAGDTGTRNTTIASLQERGRILSGSQWIGAPRLNPGTRNVGVSVPDPITGGRRVVSAYDTANLVGLNAVDGGTTVPDVVNVNGQQYLDVRVGTVTRAGGTLKVNIGSGGVPTDSATNGWTMAAKQSSLFYADGSGTATSAIDWTSRNRITFTGEVADPTLPRNLYVSYVAQYGGTFDVTTSDGTTSSHTVTNAAELRDYNDFLIANLRTGNLDPARYGALFAQGYTSTSEQIGYAISADRPTDEVAQAIGNRVVMHLVGPSAVGDIASGATLEAVNSNGGAVRGEAGARVVNNGTLAATHNTGDGSALVLTGAGTTGSNNGVINGNFFRNANNTITNGAVGSTVVDLQSGSRFANASGGVINLATGSANGAGKSIGIRVGTNARATNAGVLNVGVTGSRSNGSMDGVALGDSSSAFTNAATGTIYVGRGPQTSTGSPAADIAVNQGTMTTGIYVPYAASVRNRGTITLGSLTQNAAGIYVTAAGANVDSSGTIDVNGRAAAVPRENVGILAQNAGAAGNVVNSGRIRLNGVNGTGLKSLSTSATESLVTNTGIIDVAGGADPASGTRNYGVWAEGQGSATARANVRGAVNLLGDGAIGIHARGRATVDVATGAAPRFASGSRQIGFYAFGNDARINVAGGNALDVSTAQSTLFRLDGGADFDASGLAITASGSESIGILGSGTGSLVDTRGADITVSGNGARGVVAEGGSMAAMDASTRVTLTASGAIAGVADGQKHSLTGDATGAPLASTSLTSQANLTSSASDVVGYVARNGASLTSTGVVAFSGARATGFVVEDQGRGINGGGVDLGGPDGTGALLRTGGTFANNGTIHVANGTGVRVEGTGTQRLNPAGTIAVDDGIAGVHLVDGAGLMLGAGQSAITAGGRAHGVLLGTGASSLDVRGTTIVTNGSGNAIENAAGTGAITLTDATLRVRDGAALRTATPIDAASTATFEVDGAGTGYAFRSADGGATRGDLAVGSGFTIHGNGAGATGIQALTTGSVATAANVDIASAAGGSALVAGTAASVLQSGMLTSASASAPVVDLANGSGTSFVNRGTIAGASPRAQAIRASAGNDAVTLEGGLVRGDIATGAGSDTFTWTGGALDGGLTMGDGSSNRATLGDVDTSTTYHLVAGSGGGNALTFDGTTVRGGSFGTDDLAKGVNLVSGWSTVAVTNGAKFTLTDNLRLAGGDLLIGPASTVFGGDGVHPVVAGSADGSARVINAGTIDLTNGAGSPGNRLMIDGDYSGDAGHLNLASTLDAGGPLAAQHTDRLLVNGDAAGETVLHVTPSIASTGALTDRNRNGFVGRDEGISVVQVAGASSGGAFRLDGGYVAAGPWQYGLYAFQPGSSDASQRVVGGAGNAYWDYRLANVLVCDGPCPTPTADTPAPTPAPGQAYGAPQAASAGGTTPIAAGNVRPAVVPQLPSYIASPSALALSGYRSLDNLHRRLGETRDMADMGEGLGGEPFVRYIGGNYNYTTDRSFSQYGYDADIDTHAVQLGINIFALDADRSVLRTGVAYTHGTTRVAPRAADGYSHATFDTNSIAMFVTWQHADGFYIDAIAQGDRHAGDVDTARSKDTARIRGSGWSASVETGYPFQLGKGWQIEPQLQLTRQHIALRDQTDVDGSTTHFRPYAQTIGRAGMRVDRDWTTESGAKATPYARVNYVRGWGGRASVEVGAEGYDLSQRFTGGSFGRMVEVGLGGTYAFTNRLSLYGEADWQKRLGDAGARGWGFNLGARWDF